jgi:hypothetical protein
MILVLRQERDFGVKGPNDVRSKVVGPRKHIFFGSLFVIFNIFLKNVTKPRNNSIGWKVLKVGQLCDPQVLFPQDNQEDWPGILSVRITRVPF